MKKANNPRPVSLGLILALAGLLNCWGCQNADKLEQAAPVSSRGEQKLDKFSMVESLAGKKQWELESAQAEVFEVFRPTACLPQRQTQSATH